MALKFYTIVEKGLKLKVRKFWGLIPTFVDVLDKNKYQHNTSWYTFLLSVDH